MLELSIRPNLSPGPTRISANHSRRAKKPSLSSLDVETVDPARACKIACFSAEIGIRGSVCIAEETAPIPDSSTSCSSPTLVPSCRVMV